ncbi:ATP-binding protein [Spongiactinospora sp. 9N601]|uniref:ATP-binding protein n=1 Tax=Spongiactinospora sp. 9N601 TaxID=3375149 RepID=UPI0037A2C697
MNALVGRRNEIARFDALLEAAKKGRGGALVLRGEPGIGKSALASQVAQSANGFLVMRASGAEFEMELPFAALHQLCAPILGHMTAMPAPYRRALEVAFGLDSGVPDPLRVGVATLSLLAEAARDRPVLCVIDDAHWLDRASATTLAFLARRVSAERIAVVFAAREDGPQLGDLPVLTLGGLNESDARALLAGAIRGPLDARVRDRILAESRGNPLALLELPRTAGLAGLAGGFDLPGPGVIEQSFRARLQALPPHARLLVTIAAAEPLGDAGLLWRAAGLLGLDPSAGAQAASLVEFGTRIRFSHPLARSAAYETASPEDRRRAHRALATVTDPVADPDRRAWHRARAAAGPDEEIAAELEGSATRAEARGGIAAAAAFLERSAALTLVPELRAERMIAAAQAKLSVGEFDAAAELISAVRSGDPRQAARIDLLRGRLSFARHRGGETPATPVLSAASRLAEVDPAWSRACFLDAFEMGVLAGDLGQVVAAAQTAPPAAEPPTGSDIVLDSLVEMFTRGHEAAARRLGPIVGSDDEVWAGRPSLGFVLAGELWDSGAMYGIASRTVAAGRDSGSFHLLPIGLAMLATVTVHKGDFGAAMEMISEEEAIAEATGAAPLIYPRIHLAALRGRREEALKLFASVPEHMTLSVQWATAVLHNGLADYQAAGEAARLAIARGYVGLSALALPELVEAAMRGGHVAEARAALAALGERARAGRRPWGLGVEAYARALVTGDEKCYEQAVDLLDGCSMAIYGARAYLLYGEWLRRQGRRREARNRLRTAHEMFADLGAEAFAERAAGELRATGEHARSRTAQASDRLTMQEVHIARMVAEGATSKEVAAKLFLSPRTVDAHLRNIFRKLGITSRKQLRGLPGIR